MVRYIVFAFEEGKSRGGCLDIVFSFSTWDDYDNSYESFDILLGENNFTDFQVYDTTVRDMIFSDKKKHEYDSTEDRVLEYLEKLSLTLSY